MADINIKLTTVTNPPPEPSSGADLNKGNSISAPELDQNFINLRAAIQSLANVVLIAPALIPAHDITSDLASLCVSGTTIYLPKGTYYQSSEIDLTGINDLTIIGDGMDSTILSASGFNGLHFKFTDCHNISFKNIQLLGEGIDSSHSIGGLYFTIVNNSNVTGIQFNNVKIKNVTNDAIAINTPIMSSFKNVTATMVAGNCFNMWNGTSVEMVNSYALTSTQAGFRFDSMTYCDMRACAAEVNGIGYDFINSKSFVLSGCGAEDILNRSTSYNGYSYRVSGSGRVITAIGCYSRNPATGEKSLVSGGTLNQIDCVAA